MLDELVGEDTYDDVLDESTDDDVLEDVDEVEDEYELKLDELDELVETKW